MKQRQKLNLFQHIRQQEKENNSNFSLMKMNDTLTKQRPKQKHHIEVNYQTL